MGRIEYLKGELDANGKNKWYYRFFSDANIDVTEEFKFLGRKVRLKYCKAILMQEDPRELFEILNSKFKNFVCEELEKAERLRSNCTKGDKCSNFCDSASIANCEKSKKRHDAYLKNLLILEAINTPYSNYINNGTKHDYEMGVSNKLYFEQFYNINKVNSKYNNITRCTIKSMHENNCTITDNYGNEQIIDITTLLQNIVSLRVYITNLELIRNWKNFV